MGSECTQVVTKEFLENALGRKVESFSIQQRADTGDNFMSILYNLDVTVTSNDKGNSESNNTETETLHLISKCYPNNAGRQEYLNTMGIFWKELDFYKIWVPELLKFTQELGLKDTVKLNFPALIAGDTYNPDDECGNSNNKGNKLIGPFENYVMMVDLCKSYGFKLADRHVRLDKDHLLLVVETLAKTHALSWAYKTQKKVEVIKEKFPSMVFDYDKGRTTFESVMASTVEEAIESLKSNPDIDPQVLAALINFKGPCNNVMKALFGESVEPEEEIEKHFRVKPKNAPESTEVPWRVVIHGDCQLVNMLFRYNPDTNKPEEVVLVDFQLSREASPVIDLVYFMYTSTFLETRQNHCDEILELYYERFNYFCKIFQTETLPGFNLQELKRRYQRSKIFGFLISLLVAPNMLKEKEDAVQQDAIEGNQEEILMALSKGMSKSTRYSKYIGTLAQEFYDEGII